MGRRGEEIKVRDSHKWKKVQLRPVKRFHRRKEAEGDPHIGLPTTHRDTQEKQKEDKSGEGDHQQLQQPVEGHPAQRASRKDGAPAHHPHGKGGPGDHSTGPPPPGDKGTGRECSTGGTG